MLSSIQLIILILAIVTQAQKINEPKPTCSSINKCNCEFICKTYATNADESFGQSGKDLVEVQCMDGITSNGYEALGKDLSICLHCIRSNTKGAKSSNQLIFWSNICDKAWSTSISSAVDDLGKSFDKIPNGQVTCTNNTVSGRDYLSPYFLFERATTAPHPAPAPHRATAHAPAVEDDDLPAPVGATNGNIATHATLNDVEAAATGGNAQTLSQNRGMTTGQSITGGPLSAAATSIVGAGQVTQTTQPTSTATNSKLRKKKKTKKCKNGAIKGMEVGLSKVILVILGASLGVFLLCIPL